MVFSWANPTCLCLEIPPAIQQAAWEQSQTFSRPAERWTTYINRVCLGAFLPWFQDSDEQDGDETVTVRPAPQSSQAASGVAIELGDIRIVLIPTENIDTRDVQVPQAWVETPDWTADYYIFSQVNLDEGWLNSLGYISHANLEAHSHYDPEERAYCLDSDDLIPDLDVLWVAHQLCPQLCPQTQTAIAPGPEVSLSEGRLILPLEAPLVTLSKWFQGISEAGWQSIDELLRPQQLAFNCRSELSQQHPMVKKAKLITSGPESGAASLLLLMEITATTHEKVEISVQLHPTDAAAGLPSCLTLILRSASGTTLQSVSARNQDDYIQLKRFRFLPDQRFQLQVSAQGFDFQEDFVI